MANSMIDNTPKCDAHPDYKQEYYRLTKENERLKNENAHLRETIVSMCKKLFHPNNGT